MGETPYEADLVTYYGVLISREALAKVGYIRPDYFIGFWVWEHCIRVREAGFSVIVLPPGLIMNLAAGSGASGHYPPWRGYYQTRNHLSMALERRSLRELFWWRVRQLKFTMGIILNLDSKGERLRFRALGAWHALLQRLGKTIDPAPTLVNKSANNAA